MQAINTINQEREGGRENETVRHAAERAGICNWEIAERIHISEFTFSRWLRRELPNDLKEKVMQAIKEIIQERELKAPHDEFAAGWRANMLPRAGEALTSHTARRPITASPTVLGDKGE